MRNDNIASISRDEPAKHRTRARRASRNPTKGHKERVRGKDHQSLEDGAIPHVKMGDSMASCNLHLTILKYCCKTSWNVTGEFSSLSLQGDAIRGFMGDMALWENMHSFNNTTPPKASCSYMN